MHGLLLVAVPTVTVTLTAARGTDHRQGCQVRAASGDQDDD